LGSRTPDLFITRTNLPPSSRGQSQAPAASVRHLRLCRSAWEDFIPFLDYDAEIRAVICSTNAIESLDARYRRPVKARGHFPTEQAALKCLYLVTRSLDPTGTGRTRWAQRWKPAINAFSITFGDRFPAAQTY
jgi:putative transposase